MVVVKWSACLPSTPTIQVRNPLKSTIFQKNVVENIENKQKETSIGPFPYTLGQIGISRDTESCEEKTCTLELQCDQKKIAKCL